MKKLPLSVQIWVVFILITIIVSFLFILVVPTTLRNFFAQEIYLTIKNTQAIYLSKGLNNANALNQQAETPAERDQLRQDKRTVNHVVITKDGKFLPPSRQLMPIMQSILLQIQSQTGQVGEYRDRIGGETIFYVIRKADLKNNKNQALLSYVWGSYQNDLVRTLYKKLSFPIIIAILLSLVPSFWLIQFVSRPLVRIQKRVKRIADRDWHEPIVTDRSDEIGQLAMSVESMREQLVRQNEAQKIFLQHVSHELKTPVMVIRSYVQSIKDGIFPKGDLPGSIEVIEEQSERLEKRIHDLLYLTKLDYISSQEAKLDPIAMKPLVERTIDRLRLRRPELQWVTRLLDVAAVGSADQWEVALENILDNQIRYAKSIITVDLSSTAILRIWNDGPAIPEAELQQMFQPFHIGKQGHFGLGLAIVRGIADIHHARVWAANEVGGVAFYFDINAGIIHQ